MNNSGLLIVLSGPSGAGKDTVLKELLKQQENVRLSVSATSRQPRTGEIDGEDYYFVSREEFQLMLGRGDVLESAEYCGNFYGTPRKPVDQWRGDGFDVILEIEVQGGAQVKKSCPDCVGIFILPPSVRELEHRLRSRGTETEEAIQKRLKTAAQEIPEAENYDYIVINDALEQAVKEIQCIILAEKHKVTRNSKTIEGVLNHD